MDIFLTKDGKSVGPFSPEELRAKIKKGDADLDESAWSAETGDWKRLELVLEHAERSGDVKLKRFGAPPSPPADEEDKKSKRQKRKDKKKKEDAEPKREKSTKLQQQGPPGVPSSGKKGKGPAPVRALGSGNDRGGGGGGGRRGGGGFAGLGGLRWLALVGFAVFFFSIFLPWVTVTSENGRSEMNAIGQVTAKAEKIAIPGSNAAPKNFRIAKMVLMGVGLIGLLVGGLSFLGALNPRGSNWLAVMLAVLGVAGLGVFGYLQTTAVEGEFNRGLERMALERGVTAPTVEFALAPGYWFCIAALLLMAAFLLVPRGGRGGTPIPFFVFLLAGLGVGGWGVKEMGSGGEEMFKDAFADLKEKSSELGGVVKEKIEEIEEKIENENSGGAAPGSGGSDPFN